MTSLLNQLMNFDNRIQKFVKSDTVLSFFFFFLQVIYRALPKWESLDPFGEVAQRQLRLTNVRIRLLQRQPCPCQAKDLGSANRDLPTRHFAIYDLIVKGSCFCNGHAEQCIPAPGYRPIRDRTQHVVRQQSTTSTESFPLIHPPIYSSFFNCCICSWAAKETPSASPVPENSFQRVL